MGTDRNPGEKVPISEALAAFLSSPDIKSVYTMQGRKLWEAQGKDPSKPHVAPKRKRNVQQCSGCGQIFGGVYGFSRHRRGMKCSPPESVGLIQGADGVWRNQVAKGLLKLKEKA